MFKNQFGDFPKTLVTIVILKSVLQTFWKLFFLSTHHKRMKVFNKLTDYWLPVFKEAVQKEETECDCKSVTQDILWLYKCFVI